jgi:hypothetical protein
MVDAPDVDLEFLFGLSGDTIIAGTGIQQSANQSPKFYNVAGQTHVLIIGAGAGLKIRIHALEDQ